MLAGAFLKEQPETRQPWPARLPFYYGWIILPSAALALFVSGPGQTYSVSQFVDPLIAEFSWSRTTISGLYTAGSLTAAGAMLGVGWLLDRFGARVMLTGIGLMMGLAAIWMSLISNQIGLYAGFTALRVFGQGSLTLVPSSLVALWFIRRRGKATALASLGMVASQAVFPPLIHTLITRIGWRDTWVVLAIIVWVIVIPVAIVLIRRSPESVGLRPDGVKASAAGEQHIAGSEQDYTLREALRTRSFWLVLIASAPQSLLTTALVFHQAAVFDSRGLTSGMSAAVLAVMGPVSLGGTMVGGFLADRVPNRYLLLAGQAMLVVSTLLILVMTELWQAFVYGAVVGFASGGLITISAVIWPAYYGRRHLGSIRGAATTSMVAGAALGPLPFAFAFEVLGSYTSVLTVFLVFPVVSVAAAYFARPPQQRTQV